MRQNVEVNEDARDSSNSVDLDTGADDFPENETSFPDDGLEDGFEPADTSQEDEADMDERDDSGQTGLFDPVRAGLKEISNLGKFTVSSHKQGNGVAELRSDDLSQYWQYAASHGTPRSLVPY
jgi:anaphase-promoting complex subunit 10